METEPQHIKHWNGRQPINIDELIEKYRVKQIGEYEENGHRVRVFEPRFGCKCDAQVVK